MMLFKKISNESNFKLNTICVHKGSEFYNRSMKSWLESNVIEMYSTHNEGKSVVTERFIKTLKSKINKYMTSVSKNMYIDKLGDIVNKHNNTIIVQLKWNLFDVKSNAYIDSSNETNNANPKCKIGDIVRISKYRNISAKHYRPNWSENIFVIEKVKNTVPWIYVINDLNGEKNFQTYFKNELQKTSQKEFGIEKVIKREGDKLYVKWKGYNNLFNRWISIKDIV